MANLSDPQWQIAFARARALELKIYIAVLDASRMRAFAVDPDGAVVCGTSTDTRSPRFSYDPSRTQHRWSRPEPTCEPDWSEPIAMPRGKVLAAALAVATLLAAAPRPSAQRTGSFKLAVPSGPIVSGSRITVTAQGIPGPFTLELLGPGSVENHHFIAPAVTAPADATLIGASSGAIALSNVRIVPPPAPGRPLIAVATYDNGIALHDPKTFALLGYVPIGGAPGDVAFAPDGDLLAAGNRWCGARANRSRSWRSAVRNVPLGNEVALIRARARHSSPTATPADSARSRAFCPAER